MIIRAFKDEDYEQVILLLKLCKVETPQEPSDLHGLCLVAEDEGRIIGNVWALVGRSSQAHVDYLAVHPDHRKSHVGWNLVKVLDETFKRVGVHRYTFHIEPDDTYFTPIIEKYREANRVTRLRDLHFYRREIV